MAKKKNTDLSPDEQKALDAKAATSAEITDIRERFEKIAQLRNRDFKRYKDDIHFLYIDHWDEKTRAQRDGDNRLTLQVDKLLQYQHQVVNDSRMNRPQIKVTPVQGGAKETAEVFDGLIRHIQERSNADAAYDTALECATGGGFGFFRLEHEYAHEETFEQEIIIRSVTNPLTVYFGMYKEPDGSDVMEVFITEDIPVSEFKTEHPEADLSPFSTDGEKYGDWMGENIRVAERFWVVKRNRVLNLLPDGSIIKDEDYQAAKVQLPPGQKMPAIMDQREIPVNVVMWAKLYGAGYLEEPTETIWCGIPVIPVWGNVQNINGEVRHVSMIHNSKDAQLLYDYSRSAFAERVGQTPDSPWVAPAGAIENYQDEWDGTKKTQVKRWDHVDEAGQPLPKPERPQPADIPTGFAQDMQLSEHDIQGTLGMYQASLGRQGNATSGVQEREQARKGDVATFHYHDNLARGLKYAGKLMVYGAPKVYDTKRAIRILGADGGSDTAQLDPRLPVPYQQTGQQKFYNLALGIYGVTVSTGPSYQTRRQEAAAQMAQIASADPQFMPLYGDLFFKAQDWPFADELAKRAKLLLPPQIQQAEKQEGQVSPETQAAMQQAQQAIQQRDQQMQQMQAALQEAGNEIKSLKAQEASDQNEMAVKDAEVRLKDRENQIKAFEAETRRMEVEMEQQQAIADAARVKGEQANAEGQNNALSQGIQTLQQSAEQIAQAAQAIMQAAANLEAAARAPKHKKAVAKALPNGDFELESLETVQ